MSHRMARTPKRAPTTLSALAKRVGQLEKTHEATVELVTTYDVALVRLQGVEVKVQHIESGLFSTSNVRADLQGRSIDALEGRVDVLSRLTHGVPLEIDAARNRLDQRMDALVTRLHHLEQPWWSRLWESLTAYFGLGEAAQ